MMVDRRGFMIINKDSHYVYFLDEDLNRRRNDGPVVIWKSGTQEWISDVERYRAVLENGITTR